MFSPILFGFSNPNSCLVLLFFLSYFHHFPCALSQIDPRFCDTLFHCGNITAGFPFWGEARPEPCGHPSLGLHCDHNNTFLVISGQMYSVLHIDNSTNTLGLARQNLGESFCNSTLTGKTLTPELFQLSPEYTTLFVYYLCRPHLPNPSNFKCPKLGAASLYRSNENHKHCATNFNITVPTSYVPEREALNLNRLFSVLKKGFKVKLMIDGRPCQECKTTGGICGYNVATPVCCKRNSPSKIKCTRMIPSGRMVASGSSDGTSGSKSLVSKFFWVAGFFGAFLVLGVTIFHCRKRKTPNALRKRNLKALIPLKQYTYTEVKRITKSLAEVVGKGGFGTVYRGNLRDGRMVAVKLLKESNENGEDFVNEVASMSKTSHVNIVSLLGFCYEGSKRAIIYEYLENGSLDQFISSKTPLSKDWRTLYGIALGIARGLEYLHNGCQTRIVHFDIKPQNVLLDYSLCPKVSDFGLAKLCGKRESILSLLDIRGTIGYIAPEVFSRIYGSVSHKSDVYSYGMLVIEMIGARNRETSQNSESNTSSMYFHEWIHKDLENGNYRKLLDEEMTVEEEGIAKKMSLVGLWCIQSSPSNRPPMNRVIEMLEGSVEDLEVPPKPVSHHSATQFPKSSWLSEESSDYSEV